MSRWQYAASVVGAFLVASALALVSCTGQRKSVPALFDGPVIALPGSTIVKFRDGVRPFATALPEGVSVAPIGATLVPNLFLVKAGALAGDADGWLADADRRGEIEYAHPDYFLYTASQQPTDVDFPKQWGLEAQKREFLGGVHGAFTPNPIADIDALRGWDVYKGSGKVTVAVVDTGLMIASADLRNRLWRNGGDVGVDFVFGGGVLNDGDATGHGTRVASIIGAQPNDAAPQSIVGVIQNCRLMPLRVFETVSTGGKPIQSAPVSRIIQALAYAGANGAQVINNSYGAHKIADALALRDAIDALRKGGRDCLFVCAAGNTGADLAIDPYYPASFGLPHMLSVTSTDSGDMIPHLARNHGLGVDLAAPGENIWAGGKYNYGYASGSSFATAFVSGAAALVWDYRPTWSAAQVKQSILQSVRTAPRFAGLVESGGVLNLGNLMELAKQHPSGPP